MTENISGREVYRKTTIGEAYKLFYSYYIFIDIHQRIIEDMAPMASDATKFNVTFVNEDQKSLYIVDKQESCYLLK